MSEHARQVHAHTPRQPPHTAPRATPLVMPPAAPPVEPLFSAWRIRLWIGCSLAILAAAVVFGADWVGGRNGDPVPSIVADWTTALAGVALVIAAVDFALLRYTNHAASRFLAAMEMSLDARLAAVLVDSAATRAVVNEQLGELVDHLQALTERVEKVDERLDAALSHAHFSGYARAVQDIPDADNRVVPLLEQRRQGSGKTASGGPGHGPGSRPGA